MKLSIVSTLYRSAYHLPEFYHRSSQAAQQLVGDDYEIVLVNDGSPDNSLEIAVSLAQKDKHVVVVDLSRNFGHHKAMMTALDHSLGELVYLLDSDLEDQPEWISQFLMKLNSLHCDVVYGVQDKRRGGIYERVSGYIFYRLIRVLTRIDIPINLVTARLMTRPYLEALLRHKEREVFIAGLWQITGFDQHPHPVSKARLKQTSYTIANKISILTNAITSFSNAPLILIFYMGILILFLSTTYTMYLLANKIFFSRPLSGWTSMIVSIWILGGLTVSFIGVIGIYLAKIFSEIKHRPYTIVRRVYGR